MKPFKTAEPLAHWVLRLLLVAYLILLNVDRIYPINLTNFYFYIAATSCLLASLILVGGFISKPSLTVFSGLAILVISAFLFAKGFSGIISHSTLVYLIPAALGLYFFTKGNKA